MTELSADKFKIGELLSQKFFFHIPTYQRPFSWEQTNFEDLIDDIATADPESSYFLGTLVLHKIDDQNNYDIVDGQQRLTSLLILLACLRDAVQSKDYKDGVQKKILEPENVVDKIKERVRVQVREIDDFDKFVIQPDGTKDIPAHKAKPDPLRRYLMAIKVFSERASEYDEAELQRIISFISQNCFVMVLSTEDFEEAFRLFAIVNDRGKQLRRIDVLKSINISPTLISQETARQKYAAEWANLENELGEDTFESIFYLLRLSLLKDKPQGDLLREFEDRVFKAKILQKGTTFLNGAFEYAKTYRSVFVDRDIIEKGAKNYNKFNALMYIMDSEFKASEWRAAIISFVNKFGPDLLYEFCCEVEKLFLDHWLNAVRKDERYSSYSRLLTLIETEKNPNAVISAIEYDEGQIKKSIVDSRAYGAGYCKYILLRLEFSTAEHDSLHFFSAKSIEHVLPQNPDEGSKWLQIHDADKLGAYVHSFGNLVLLSKGKNSAAGNLEFDEKKKRYLQPRVTDYPRSVQVLGVNEWTEQVIAERTKEAAELIFRD